MGLESGFDLLAEFGKACCVKGHLIVLKILSLILLIEIKIIVLL